MTKLIFAIIISFIFQFPTISPVDLPETNESEVNFVRISSLEEGLRLARQQQKPLFLDFTADWCGPCQRMDRVVFGNPSIASFMNSNFVSVKINVDTPLGKAAKKRYDVKFLPTLIFLSPEGNIIKKRSSNMGPNEFLNFAYSAKDESYYTMTR